MSKILFLNHNVIGKSTYHRCFCLARELVLFGHSVTLLTNSEKDRIKFKEYLKLGVQIVECPDLFWDSLRTGWDPVNMARRCLYLTDKQFDLIHAFDTRLTVIIPALFYLIFIKKVPLVIDWADWWGKGGAITLRPHKLLNRLFSPVETFFEEYFRKYADHTTVISTALYKRAKNLGLRAETISILHSGADTRTIYPVNKVHAREELGLPDNVKICVFPGFVLYDLKMVLDTFQYIHARNPNIILLLLGEYPKILLEPYQTFLDNNSIRIIGNVGKDKLRLYLSASDVALLPLSDTLTNRARFPMKFGDYLASGIPFVTNKVGDIGNLVEKYKLGFLVDYSASSMGEKILWIFDHPKEAEKISKRALRFARKKFSWEIVAQNLITIYHFLLKLNFDKFNRSV
jgi:glycosyltransferase involved in cell wall biosynthesis